MGGFDVRPETEGLVMMMMMMKLCFVGIYLEIIGSCWVVFELLKRCFVAS